MPPKNRRASSERGPSNKLTSANYTGASPIEQIHEAINRVTLPVWVANRYRADVLERHGVYSCRCVVHGGQDDYNATMRFYNSRWWYRCWSRCSDGSLDVLSLVLATGEAGTMGEAIKLLQADLGIER